MPRFVVLVTRHVTKLKPMTETPESSAPQGTPSNAAAVGRRRSAIRTFLLAVGLSAAFLLAVAAYLYLSPGQSGLRPSAPAPVVVSRASDTVVVIAPRFLVTPELVADFQNQTGLKVELAPYDNEETLLSVTGTGAVNADVLVVAGSTFSALARNDQVAVLPARQIGNLGRIDPSLRALTKRYDSMGLSSVPYAWTTIGLGVNRAALNERTNASLSLDSWTALFDESQVRQAAACGVQSVDAPSLAFPPALLSLGLDAYSNSAEDVERASAAWETIRPSITALDTGSLVDNLGAGQVCLALSNAADVFRAQANARDSGRAVGLDFIVPREGAFLRLYVLAQPRNAQNADQGAKLIDYLLRPDVAARMTNATWAANAVPSSLLYVRQDIKDNAAIYPPLDSFSRLIVEASPPAAVAGLRDRFWLLLTTTERANQP